MKKTIKKGISLVALCIALTSSSMYADALEEHLDPGYFMNIAFDVPDNWEYLTEEIGDTRAQYIYACGYEELFIYSVHYEDEYNETVDYLYDTMVGLAATSFSDDDSYTLLSGEDYEIDGCLARDDNFMYTMNNQMYYFKIISVNTGYEIVDFIYARPIVGTDNPGSDTFQEMVDNIKIGDSESVSASETLTKYDSGMYKVGDDIPAGEYVVFADDSKKGYFCVSSDSNKNDILFNDNFDYNSIITINDGEYLELSRSYAVPLAENPDVEVTGTGMFLVGTHIPAGEYKLDSGTEKGYYCIYSSSRQDNIVANSNFEGQNYVTVSDGQYLVLSRCSFTEPPEKPVKIYTDPDTVRKVQETLNNTGYNCGTPDGVAGNSTVSAIEDYQTDNGLSVTGTITDELLEALEIQNNN